MDIVYLFKHNTADDAELLYSLRSVAKNLSWIRKIWIFGDRPAFLADNGNDRIENVQWEQIAWVQGVKAPVRNFFLQCFLAALHPNVADEFLLFCDDYIILEPLTKEVLCRDRYLEDLDHAKSRGSGLWKEALWRTYDWLKRLNYAGLNFETHTPMYLTKRRVFEAYRELRDYVTEDRFYGMLGPTAILNHAYKQRPFPLTLLSEENLKAGFYDKPAAYSDIVNGSREKAILNFDDTAFTDDMRRFLGERFPEPCNFELSSNAQITGDARSWADIPGTHVSQFGVSAPETLTETSRVADFFREVYRQQSRIGGETVSGRGATLVQTQRLRRELPRLFAELEIHSVLDVPCGDWNWMKHVDLSGVRYVGGEIVEELIARNRQFERRGIEFQYLDLLSTALPTVDLILCRDCLVHFTDDQVRHALNNVLRSKSRFLATTTFPGRSANSRIMTGQWRPLNLELEPFRLPRPQQYIFEACTEASGRFADKSLGVWRVDDLAAAV